MLVIVRLNDAQSWIVIQCRNILGQSSCKVNKQSLKQTVVLSYTVNIVRYQRELVSKESVVPRRSEIWFRRTRAHRSSQRVLRVSRDACISRAVLFSNTEDDNSQIGVVRRLRRRYFARQPFLRAQAVGLTLETAAS